MDKMVNVLLFVDDMELVADSEGSLQMNLDEKKLDETLRKWEMNIGKRQK